MRYTLLVLILVAVVLLDTSHGVNHTMFKTCDQSSFCRRCRALQPGISKFQLSPGTMELSAVGPQSLVVDLINTENSKIFALKVTAVKDNTFRLEIDEKTPLKARYRVEDALKGDLTLLPLTVTGSDITAITITVASNKAVINAVPFRVDLYNNNVLSVSLNAKGLMRFEHLRSKDEVNATSGSIEDSDTGSWEEYFLTFLDTKPNGPEAIAMDFTFPQANVVFGIPEHADSFSLRNTIGSEPYRLYNLDVAYHELDNGMSLYGAVPILYGHGAQRTAGVFWHNAAETWVDIYNYTTTSSPAANFMSESGIIDVFILMGPTPNDAFKQYTDLTGVAPLPQLYTLAYHQCRWNYMTQQDVMNVSNNFDVYDIPMDTMWLDIEYTDGKRYFTWEPTNFSDPLFMIQNLTDKGRHLTIIVDIHIKRDSTYSVHTECTENGYYTKNLNGEDFAGTCWPGDSSYPDVFQPATRTYLAEHYSVARFPNTTEDVMIWNDMNEPSVFDGPESTMPKDNIHYGNWEHRDVHNLFGHMQLRSTYAGLGARSSWQQRPFVLTRSHFAGSQRYSTIWTGDNTAEWGYLKVAIKTCLSEAVAGFSFCGGDVGGFFGNPDEELFERWYQAASFQPFFRSHANIDSDRREPWLFRNETRLRIRDAIRKRYSYLPLWYTMFYEHQRYGLPVMRPMLSQYPQDLATFAMDNQYMLSNILLVHPVAESGVTEVNVYFPADLWYDIDTYVSYNVAGYTSIPVDGDKTPVYQRGGTILAKKQPIRLASTLMINDPYSLVVCVNSTSMASGTLFIDDEKSFNYQNNSYLYISFEFSEFKLTKSKVDSAATYATTTVLEQITVAGLNKVITTATIAQGSSSTTMNVTQDANFVVIFQNPGVRMIDEWTITFNGAGRRVAAIFVIISGTILVNLFSML